MKRMQKIERLVAVGFNATELSNMGNTELNAVYDAAHQLMTRRKDEIERVRRIENLRARAMKRQLAEHQHDKELEEQWSRRWKPLESISSTNMIQDREGPPSNTEMLALAYDERAERFSEMFRQSGDKQYADAANAAKDARDALLRAEKEAHHA